MIYCFLFIITLNVRTMSTQKVSQQLFLSVKQKLDNYHLSTTFPIQVTPLLYKLTQLIDGSNSKHSHIPVGASGQGLSAALRHQMSRILKQNNKLHMDIITARQEIQSLNHRLYKFDANKHVQDKESNKLSSLKQQREQELVQQLRQIKFKYNQLMDFIHEDPQNQRQYIKRLMKHKHSKLNKGQGQEFKQSNSKVPHYDENSSQRIRELQSKIKNRQAQILRLQNLTQYDGLNMNKIIKNFQDSLAKNKLQDADHKINFLEQSVDKIKKENQNMKNKNGSKQALRAQVQKCHSIINKLKGQNQQLRRNHKQQDFDLQKHKEQQERKVSKVKSQKEQIQKQTQRKQEHIIELDKKISFLQRQCKQLRGQLDHQRKRLSMEQENLAAQHKKNQELKVFYQYEIETYKKKLHQIQFEAHQLKSTNQKLLHQYDLTRRESDLKSASIVNLQKIVNELMRKNSLLSDNTIGIIEQSLRKNDDIQVKRQIVDLQQQLIHAHNQRQQLQADRNALEHRFGALIKDNQRLKIDFAHIRGEIVHKDALVSKIANDFQQAKLLLKKTQHQNSKLSSQFNELLFQKDAIEANLKSQNQKLMTSERSLRTQMKELQIRMSEDQGELEIVKIRLAEREERLKHVERLLNESVEQSKRLSSQVGQLDQKNHELSREKHRTTKKYEQLRKQSEDFKSSSFKNYEQAINDNLNEVNTLKKQISRLAQSQERQNIRYEEVTNLLNLVRRQKQLQQVDKISLCRQNEHLQLRLKQMQQIERALVLQNENLRNIARRA